MGKFTFGIFVVVILAISNAFSNNLSIFDDHKLKSYSPTKAGVKDILFDVKLDGLEDYIKKTTSLTDLEDIYFRVYWAYPSQFKVDVEGLPKGFQQLKSNLKSMVKPYIDLIFSDNFVVQFERIPFVKDSKNPNLYIKKSTELDTTSMVVEFDRNGLMNRIISMTPYSKIETTFVNTQRSWSLGKYVVTEIQIKEKVNGLTNHKTITVERELKDGVGLPAKVSLVEKLLNGDKKINENTKNFKFFNFHVNTGKPQRIMKGQKK
jgi:hypothetical protein